VKLPFGPERAPDHSPAVATMSHDRKPVAMLTADGVMSKHICVLDQ
jgi:hypothetical protein